MLAQVGMEVKRLIKSLLVRPRVKGLRGDHHFARDHSDASDALRMRIRSCARIRAARAAPRDAHRKLRNSAAALSRGRRCMTEWSAQLGSAACSGYELFAFRLECEQRPAGHEALPGIPANFWRSSKFAAFAASNSSWTL